MTRPGRPGRSARRVLECHEAGVPFMEQAVLVRAASHSDLLEIELTARGIPFIKYGGLRFTEAAHVKDFIAAARVVANPADDLAWFRLLRLHEGIGPVLARAGHRRAARSPSPRRWAAGPPRRSACRRGPGPRSRRPSRR